MVQKLLFLLLFCVAGIGSWAQVVLTVEISDIRSSTGVIHLELSNNNKGQIAAISKNISNKKCIFVIENLQPGKYAFKFIHDENINDKLDTNWLGIPKEGFGFSNNPSMTFGPPSFEKTVFEITESMTIRCKPKYF